MIAIWLIAVGLVASRFHWRETSFCSSWERLLALAACAAVIAAVLCGLSFAYTEIAGTAKLKVTRHGSHRIVQLSDGSKGELEGHFFLGIGSIEGGTSLAYTWYQREPGGYLRGVQVPDNGYNEVWVLERAGVEPSVKWFDSEDPCHTPWWVAPIHQLCEPTYYRRSWTLTVPPGTVVRNFDLNGAG